MNGYNFTERVRVVLNFAREEAQALRHEYVGTEHILLGLIREGEGVAGAVLANLGAEVDDIRDTIGNVVIAGKEGGRTGPDLPYTSRAKKVIEFAMKSAVELHHNYVGTEHILIGLLREEKGIAAQVLVDAGISLDGAIAETRRLLGEPLPDESVRIRLPVASVKVELNLKDGSVVNGEFTSTSAAIDFLRRQ